MLQDFGVTQSKHVTMFSVIAIAKHPQYHGRAKRIEIKYLFVRSQVNNEVIKVIFCPTDYMLADVLTKGLSFDKHVKFRKEMRIVEKNRKLAVL